MIYCHVFGCVILKTLRMFWDIFFLLLCLCAGIETIPEHVWMPSCDYYFQFRPSRRHRIATEFYSTKMKKKNKRKTPSLIALWRCSRARCPATCLTNRKIRGFRWAAHRIFNFIHIYRWNWVLAFRLHCSCYMFLLPLSLCLPLFHSGAGCVSVAAATRPYGDWAQDFVKSGDYKNEMLHVVCSIRIIKLLYFVYESRLHCFFFSVRNKAIVLF